MHPPHTTSADAINPGARRVQVLLPLPLEGAYDYRVPEDVDIEPGAFVSVPFGRRDAVGVVWAEGGSDAVGDNRLKDVNGRLAASALPENVRRFVDWVAAYTVSARGTVLRMAMSVPAALEPPRSRVAYARVDPVPEFRETDARRRVLAVLADGPPRPAADLAREAGVGTGVVAGLADAGVLARVPLVEGPPPAPDPDCPGPLLSAAQQATAQSLIDAVRAADYDVALLDGVTGAGKTEVYFEALAETFRQGRQALVLLPEIALTIDWLERFTTRFGAPPVQWHSDLTQSQRRRAWRTVASGEASVVVGARSALFLPFPRLGLIVVDEEHDPSYKQQDGVAYNARDMAVVRASIEGCPAVLASATPSLETVINVERGRYRRLALPDRHRAAAHPDVHIVDMRKTPPGRGAWISPPLREALQETVAQGEQALLFLNRRGYAPLTLCRTCGYRFACPNCTAWLVSHRLARRLECHHCGYTANDPEACPQCGAEDALVACGPGVERLAEEATALLPDARLATLTSDDLRGPAAARELFRRVRDREVDVLIGTQLVAKGHHFPLLTLVGVVDADLGLTGGDLRAAERTYQLLHQVAGRAGRAEHPGRVFLQTYAPEHPVMAALADGARDRFLDEEAADREAGGWPPFGRLAALILSGPDPDLVDGAARALSRTAPRGEGIRVLGPAPAPLAMLRGRHRRRLLLKAARSVKLQGLIRAWIAQVRMPASVRLQVDIDPYSFM
jgi:primosomal protein N' (replication factor Y)